MVVFMPPCVEYLESCSYKGNKKEAGIFHHPLSLVKFSPANSCPVLKVAQKLTLLIRIAGGLGKSFIQRNVQF